MPPQLSPYSIGSLIVGALGLVGMALGGIGTVIGLLLGLLAIALGGMAIRDISLGGSSARGTGLAVVGMLIGAVLLLGNAYKFAATGCAPLKTFKGMYEKAGETPE